MEPSDTFEATKFRVKKLFIVTASQTVDISSIFEELNIFDNLFLSCMSGNVMIRDSINLIESLNIDGGEEIVIELDKGEDTQNRFLFKKTFKLQKLKEKKNVNHTTVIYTLHFVSDEFLISQRTKVRKFYEESYSNICRLVVEEFFPNAKIGTINQSSGIFRVWPHTLSPFNYLDWISRRAVSALTNKPDYLFYETQDGYNFESISEMYNKSLVWSIGLGAKDLERDNESINELVSARDFKVVNQFNLIDGIEQGIFGGTFMMFDPLTRRWDEPTLSFETLYGPYWPNHANIYPNIPEEYKTETFSKSRMLSYPYQQPRKRSEYIRNNDSLTSQYTDNTEEYVFSRQHNIGMLSQKRILMTISGNFIIKSGSMIYLEVPEFKGKQSADEKFMDLDLDLTGRYLVTAVRHVIKYDKHETVLEVSADSLMSS